MIIFDSTLYYNKPQSVLPGMKPLYLNGSVIDEQGQIVQNECDKVSNIKDKIICLDIETLPISLKIPREQLFNSMNKLGEVLDIIRRISPHLRIGYYSLMPWRDYFTPISNDESKTWQWHLLNGLFKYSRDKNGQFIPNGLADKVDILFPSLYTFYNNPTDWTKYAKGNIKEARKYQKQIYSFLCPYYHTSNKDIGGTEIDPDFWKLQLELCAELSDGISIWGGNEKNWDESLPWWKTTQEFMIKNKLL